MVTSAAAPGTSLAAGGYFFPMPPYRPPGIVAQRERRAAELKVDEAYVRREHRRALWISSASCLGGMLAGLALMAWGFHVNDRELGQSLMFAGLFGGQAIVLFVLARFYVVGERNGWW